MDGKSWMLDRGWKPAHLTIDSDRVEDVDRFWFETSIPTLKPRFVVAMCARGTSVELLKVRSMYNALP